MTLCLLNGTNCDTIHHDDRNHTCFTGSLPQDAFVTEEGTGLRILSSVRPSRNTIYARIGPVNSGPIVFPAGKYLAITTAPQMLLYDVETKAEVAGPFVPWTETEV